LRQKVHGLIHICPREIQRMWMLVRLYNGNDRSTPAIHLNKMAK
jgi:hypothetical protein